MTPFTEFPSFPSPQNAIKSAVAGRAPSQKPQPFLYLDLSQQNLFIYAGQGKKPSYGFEIGNLTDLLDSKSKRPYFLDNPPLIAYYSFHAGVNHTLHGAAAVRGDGILSVEARNYPTVIPFLQKHAISPVHPCFPPTLYPDYHYHKSLVWKKKNE